MADDAGNLDALILDLLIWLANGPRPHAEVMDAWRTSCPHLPVWEDANERGLVRCRHVEGVGTIVELTPAGADFIRTCRGARRS